MAPESGSCANCAEPLTGAFCSRCGQQALDLHRPISDLFSDVIGDIFNLDTRLLRTLRPLMLKPGALAKDYIAGRRASYVPPLKSYLIAALIFFGLFTLFPSDAPVEVFVQGSAEERAVKAKGGSRQTFALPAHIAYYDEWYQGALTRAMREPERFAQVWYNNIPRAFFVFLPLFALFLELLYRTQGYLVDHLVFSLYYHAFVFLDFSLFFLVRQARDFLPGPVSLVIGVALVAWLFAYLPIALRRVYGGSRPMTGVKLVALGVLYLAAFVASIPLTLGISLLQF
jgi:hypothetical protein